MKWYNQVADLKLGIKEEYKTNLYFVVQFADNQS